MVLSRSTIPNHFSINVTHHQKTTFELRYVFRIENAGVVISIKSLDDWSLVKFAQAKEGYW